MMITMLRILPALLFLCGALAGTPVHADYSGKGTVQSIAEEAEGSKTGNVVGAVGGALVGGWLGSSIGGGTGKTIATAVGAVGGAVAGKSVGNKASKAAVWYVTVRFEDGVDRRIRVTQQPNYRPGDRVSVSNGTIRRI
jgi:outer membrane lipoprotein SlyB